MILEAVAIVLGLFYFIVGIMYNFGLLSFFPSFSIIILGGILLFMERMYNCYVILISDYNGKKVFKLLKGKKVYKDNIEKKGYYLKIQGFKKLYPYPNKNFVNFNLTNNINNLLFFFQEGSEIAPVQADPYLILLKLVFYCDINFISSSLIANHYQMQSVVKNMVKPPTDSLMMIINVGLIMCMIACICTMIYQGYRNGIDMGVLNDVGLKMDQVMDGLGELMFKLQGGIVNIGEATNGTINNIPPITR